LNTVKTENAVGMVLGHDITEIIPGEFKGAAFKKGHIITENDIERLLRIGKEHVYVFELGEDELHENEAALRLGKLFAGPGVCFSEPSEGKTNIKSEHRGLLKINRELLEQVNDVEDICLATIQGNIGVEKDQLLGGCRIIPLTIKKDKIEHVENMVIDKDPIFQIKPFINLRTALIVTGSEVYKGRIEDKFGPVIEKKVKHFGSEIFNKTIVPDELDIIKDAVSEAKKAGAELIIVTGGMSVDPDDKTPGAIKAAGADIVTYGTSVLPGAMLLFAYLDGTPVFGLPGCVMYAHTTAFDLLLPRVFAGEKIVRKDITKMGYGGQCLSCKVCKFPYCNFGKH
jgi:molybdenum cofactor synthesis domain-containing protein